MTEPGTRLESLRGVLTSIGRAAIAVSGGVDSMTLAVVAHRMTEMRAEMFHATSPAVPEEATRRIQEYAAREGWELRVVDAEEFRDDAYLNNPVDRCFHCKTHLYDAIAARSGSTLVSGTNTDDLGEFRPGLTAAERHGVRHPYVEAGIDKAGVRALARHLGLDELAELPSGPCLASRVETGIPIEPRVLALVHRVEREVERLHSPQAVRCRIRAGRVVVELDQDTLDALTPAECEDIRSWTTGAFQAAGQASPVELRPYRRGSAFLVGLPGVGHPGL